FKCDWSSDVCSSDLPTWARGSGCRPGPPADTACLPCTLPALRRAGDVDAGSPFDLIAAATPVRTGRKSTLLAFSRQIESQVLHRSEERRVGKGVGAP